MFLTMRLAHRALAVLVAAAAGGCALAPPGGVQLASTANNIPVSQAFISPPPGGPQPIAVIETRFSNAYAQDIVLENTSGIPGQNVLLVRAYGPMRDAAGLPRLQRDVPDIAEIRRELLERFPGVRMELSGLYAQNRYGPLTYATGSSGRTTCVYVVQRIAAEERVFSLQRGAIVWRLRLCDRDATARDLLLVAYGLTINGYFLSPFWNPYGDAPPVDERVGTPGATILPEQVVDPTVVAPVAYGARAKQIDAAPAQQVTRPRPRTAPPVTQPPTVLNQPLPGAAVVPRPQSVDLTEPEVEGSNLPSTAPVGRPSVTVPSPSAADAPNVRTVPGVPVPEAAGPRVLLPNAGLGNPTVRVVEN